jgi:ubiquitin C-terminal hydrolase
MNNEYYCGLNNVGNTCFFNSALQSLMRCSVFINFIEKLHIDHELIKVFQEFIIEYKENSNKSMTPNKLVKYYKILNKDYRIGSQDDADEVITLIIGKIDDIIKDEIKKNPEKNIVIKGDITLDKMIAYLFGITIRTTTKCMKCSNKSNYEVTEFKIRLPIKYDNLEENITNYSKIEEMTGDEQYACNYCKQKVDALKCDQIVRTPKYMHIQLKRFENNGVRRNKITNDVKIPFKLNMNDNKYILRGFVHHMGSINGGHYIYNYNKDKDENNKNWICLDDSGISKINMSNDINQGFVYLYVK